MKVRLICLALWLLLVALALAFPGPSRAETIIACEKVELPGKEHTLNPFAPPKMQRQEKIALCSVVEVPTHNRLGPIIDRKHDPRAWA
jgi:hypothetical protein